MKYARTLDDQFINTLGKIVKMRMPVKTAFKFKNMLNILKKEQAKYEEARQEALLKYGLKNESGAPKIDDNNNVQFDEDGVEAFTKEMNTLFSLEIDLPTVKLSEFGEHMMLSPAELETLDGVVVED